MKLTDVKEILIVGLGLIGGSYAKALKKQGYRVTAIEKNESSLSYALSQGIIDEGKTCATKELLSCADLIVCALYPAVFMDWIEKNKSSFKEGTVITDVTGIKAAITEKIQSLLPPGIEFIGAHPMAGREVYGVENSDDAIFKGANYIIVPTEKNTAGAINLCRELGMALGFGKISVLSPEEHDEIIGFVSQLTHCIAVSLMTCSDNPHLVDYTGDSFRDLTRIANINENMWSELFSLNKEVLVNQMEKFIHEFSMLKDSIEKDDVEKVKEKMRLSTQRRLQFNK